MGDRTLEVLAPYFLWARNQMSWKKSTIQDFSRTPLIIRLIVNSYKVVDQFLRKPFWFFLRIFTTSCWIRCIINLSIYSNKGYTSVLILRSLFLWKGWIYLRDSIRVFLLVCGCVCFFESMCVRVWVCVCDRLIDRLIEREREREREREKVAFVINSGVAVSSASKFFLLLGWFVSPKS